ncbi:MAG: hypothetical protein AAFR87_23875 [Bacteroidota bacterium]
MKKASKNRIFKARIFCLKVGNEVFFSASEFYKAYLLLFKKSGLNPKKYPPAKDLISLIAAISPLQLPLQSQLKFLKKKNAFMSHTMKVSQSQNHNYPRLKI